MTTRDQQAFEGASSRAESEAALPDAGERTIEAEAGCPPEVDPADVRTVRQAFHLTLAQLAAIFGIRLGKAQG